jgi:Hpt domain
MVGVDFVGVVHTVAGTAGMFGFERLATSARFFKRAAEVASPDLIVFIEHLILALEASLVALGEHPGISESLAADG